MLKILTFVTVCGIFHPKSSLCRTNQTLELVHVLFRHGNRTPEKIHVYPKDPHYNVTYASIGFGQVTNEGKRKLYSLGRALRKRYKTFLGPYSPEVADARSSDYPRTKISLQLVLASLFPPEDHSVWKKDLNWQPTPYSYWPLKSDHVLGQPYRNCPRYKHLYFDFLNSTEGTRMFENYTKTVDFLTEHAGINATSKSIFELYFTLDMELENGLALPDWTKPVYPDVMRNLVFFEYHARTATAEMKRLSAGFLLKKIINDTREKIRGFALQNRRMFLYSGHELNITYLLQLLGIYYPHIPPYGAYVIIEIHNVRGIRRIKIFYQDYRTETPRRMQIPNCHNFCTFNRFVKIYKQFLPRTKHECVMENK